MDIEDSRDVRNGVRLRSILIAAILYLTAAIFTAGLILIPAFIICVIAFVISNSEIENVKSGSARFKKSFPFRYYGTSFGDFQHVFYCQADLQENALAAIDLELKARAGATALETVTITDIDGDLKSAEARVFKKSTTEQTRRGTTMTLLIWSTRLGAMQSIRWWVIVGGFIDKDKKFNFIAYSPLTLWFWIIPYLKKDYDVVSQLRTIYAASYNDMDVTTQIRCLHDVVFDALVDEMEKNGLDTGDLRSQRLQMLNINISGGRVNMGNIVQGAMNKVVNAAGGAAK